MATRQRGGCQRSIAGLAAGPLLVDPRRAFAPLELCENVRGLRTVPREQHHAVEPQIRSFAYEMQFITVLRSKEQLGRFLRDLLEDRVLAFRGEACHVG